MNLPITHHWIAAGIKLEFPAFLPELADVSLAHGIKFDGYRSQIVIDGRKVRVYSRSGLD